MGYQLYRGIPFFGSPRGKRLYVAGGMLVVAVAIAILFLFARATQAVPGDFAVYRESTGLESLTVSPLSLDWAVTVSEGTGFSIDGGRTNVTLTEQGHYLVLYSVGAETVTGSGRSELQGRITLEGQQSGYGRSTCYMRRVDGTDECWVSGAAVIESTSTNHTVSVSAVRTDANGATVRRRANDSGLALMRLDDDWSYARVRELGGGQTFNSTSWAAVDWDTNDELDIGYGRSGSMLTLDEPGHYLVTASLMYHNSSASANRNQLARLTLDGYELPGTRTSAYLGGVQSTQDHAAVFVGIIEATTTSQVLRLEGACGGESCGGITNVGGQTSITISKLPETAAYVRLTEAGGGQLVDATNDPVLWDTNTEVDNSSFSHSESTHTSRMEIDAAGDYLFFGSFFDERSVQTVTTRQYPHWEWRTNGSTKLQYGSFGKYNRGDDGGTGGAFSSGDAGGALLAGLTASDYVELVASDEATGNDSSNTFLADRMALQGVRLDTLDAPDAVVSAGGEQTATSTVPKSGLVLGDSFVVRASGADETLTDVTLTETGTVDASSSLESIRLYYETDTSSPFSCDTATYDGTETQFGATSTNFSAANGSTTMSGSVAFGTSSSLCLFVVLDVNENANDGETIAVEITSPESDVVIASGSVGSPESPTALSGVTTLTDDVLTQVHYHWRIDDDSESAAASATGGVEDTVLESLAINTPRRLRIEVSNEGSTTSAVTTYRLEYAQKAGSCVAATGWTDVGATDDDWNMFDSVNLTDGADTTNIATTTGGVTDENTTFLATNGGVRDTNAATGALSLSESEFLEMEFSIEATATSTDGATYCFRVTDGGTALAAYSEYPEVTIAADVEVGTEGTQTSNIDASSTDQYLGGVFALKEQTASRTVQSLTIAETGTVDASSSLENIRLYYELDTLNPYNCVSETYDGTEVQFGATSTNFSAANGSSTFSGSVDIATTSAMCVYVVLGVNSGAQNGETIAVEITNPGTDVSVSSGSVNPNTTVALSATTTVRKASLEQLHFHWRNDDGSEGGASSETDGVEDAGISNVKRTDLHRLRLLVSNEGGTTSASTAYELEYAERSTTCDAATGWTTVGESGAHWNMSDSVNLTDGADTTNIATTTGGVTDENTTFLATNGGVRDTTASTSPLVLAETEFLELEFSIEATTNANFGSTYCFRLTDSGAELDVYSKYAQATIRPNQDFYIQRGAATIAAGETSASLVAGSDYIAPSASTSAFIRIANTQLTGAGATSGGGTQNADDVTAYIANPSDITTGVTFTRAGTTNDTRIYWEIIEYVGPAGGDNEMIVRSAESYAMGSGNTSGTQGVADVSDDADMVVFITGQGNEDTGTSNYAQGIATGEWDDNNNEVIIERGVSGTAASFSFAAVEFTGQNWVIHRLLHTYSAAGTTEFEYLPVGEDVNDLSRAFLHTQKRSSMGGVDEFGHEVWLSGVSAVSFALQSGASSPSGHVSVAWVIENTQTTGTPLAVTRSNGTTSGGSEPLTLSVGIGTTIGSLDNASVFTTNRSSGTSVTYPQPIMGVRLASTTAYELWRSDTGGTQTYRTEVVEWPTAVQTLEQNYYRFYDDNDALDPTDAWPPGGTDLGENTAITVLDEPLTQGDTIRLRMSIAIFGANLAEDAAAFKLQYGARDTSCSAVTTWLDIGDSSSTTPAWRGNNATPLDGTALSGNPPTGGDLNLSVSDRAGTYEESNPTAANPFKTFIGEDVEYDWNLEANQVSDLTTYCFRMTKEDGASLDDYQYYPTLTTSGFTIEQVNWRWYDDETNETPTSPLAATNTSPSDIAYSNAVKLRVTVQEGSGKDGQNAKFKLQWSEHSDFSTIADVADIDTCTSGSRWCYSDGAGADNATITEALLADADMCTGGSGDGCGTHNEYSYAPTVIGEVGETTLDSTGSTVNLAHTYIDPIYILESIAGDDAGPSGNRPAAAVITATTSSSFTARLQEPDNESDTHGSETLSYIVMERGAHQLPDGTRVDADSLDISDYYGNAVGGTSDATCSFTQTFSDAPVVISALQTNNNIGTPDFLTASQLSVSASDFSCSMEVPDGETNAPGSVETFGWIAFDKASFSNNGTAFEASTTAASVAGWTDTPWYEHAFSTLFGTTPGLIATKQTRVGAEGGWVRYDGIDTDSVEFAIDERDDGERTHTANESIGYLAYSGDTTILDEGTSDFVFGANTTREFEFTLEQYDARANTTYFFRLYDVTNGVAVPFEASSSYPSLATEGATLSFSIRGIEAASSTEGVSTDVTTTPTTIPFGALTFDTDKTAAQRLEVSTNASEGYQIFMFERQDLTSGVNTFEDVTGTNENPSAWSSGCIVTAQSCYGYHAGDNTLSATTTRFLLDDTYAALTSSLEEVAYSTGPVASEETDIVYRIRTSTDQPPGYYESSIVYIVVPVF